VTQQNKLFITAMAGEYEFITLSEKEEDNVPRIKRVLKE